VQVLYRLHGKQSSTSFEHLASASIFKRLRRRVVPERPVTCQAHGRSSGLPSALSGPHRRPARVANHAIWTPHSARLAN
jgi:hypothetical protein